MWDNKEEDTQPASRFLETKRGVTTASGAPTALTSELDLMS